VASAYSRNRASDGIAAPVPKTRLCPFSPNTGGRESHCAASTDQGPDRVAHVLSFAPKLPYARSATQHRLRPGRRLRLRRDASAYRDSRSTASTALHTQPYAGLGPRSLGLWNRRIIPAIGARMQGLRLRLVRLLVGTEVSARVIAEYPARPRISPRWPYRSPE
jgi:hypothetical protein